jgi:hypothetical protein
MNDLSTQSISSGSESSSTDDESEDSSVRKPIRKRLNETRQRSLSTPQLSTSWLSGRLEDVPENDYPKDYKRIPVAANNPKNTVSPLPVFRTNATVHHKPTQPNFNPSFFTPRSDAPLTRRPRPQSQPQSNWIKVQHVPNTNPTSSTNPTPGLARFPPVPPIPDTEKLQLDHIQMKNPSMSNSREEFTKHPFISPPPTTPPPPLPANLLTTNGSNGTDVTVTLDRKRDLLAKPSPMRIRHRSSSSPALVKYDSDDNSDISDIHVSKSEAKKPKKLSGSKQKKQSFRKTETKNKLKAVPAILRSPTRTPSTKKKDPGTPKGFKHKKRKEDKSLKKKSKTVDNEVTQEKKMLPWYPFSRRGPLHRKGKVDHPGGTLRRLDGKTDDFIYSSILQELDYLSQYDELDTQEIFNMADDIYLFLSRQYLLGA